MLLELSVLSYHRLSPKQVAIKRFDSAGGTLGRSEQADWYLPDPERVVSSVHAVISFDGANYTISDKSTNGLFVNRSVEALGEGRSHQLQDGDILCLGDYEIQVALVDATPAGSGNDTTMVASVTQAKTNRLTPDAAQGLLIDELLAPALNSRNSASLAPSPQPVNAAPTVLPTQQLGLDEHFLPPAAMIPDDWDDSWQADVTQAEIAKPDVRSAQKQHMGPKTAARAETSAANSLNDDCMQAFLRGLAITDVDAQVLSSPMWWEQLGLAFAQSLQGVLSVMRERSQVKNRFRVNQTTFQQRENNPLKFSANIDDAFYNLFNRPGSSFMPAKQAIAEAFADISQHEAAIIAGAQGAMAGMLAQLAPEKLEATDIGGGFVDKLNPAQRQARCWARYKMLHQELALEVQRKDHSGVNDDFIAAYEAYLRRKA